jgi:hypothetical protein
MTKAFVDDLIRGLKLAGMVAKATSWSFEGYGDKQKSVRYVGLTLKDDWLEIFSPADNLLLKFVIDRDSAYLDYYLANKPPFFRISAVKFKQTDKWEILLGELKRRLKRDKSEVINHTDSVDNIYAQMKPHLK